MTTQEYETYKENVEHGMQGLEHFSSGVCAQCPDCQRAYDISAVEHKPIMVGG